MTTGDMMRDWMKRLWSPASNRRTPEPAAVARPGRTMSGTYLSLYTYLENRHANTVVLTFAEIEDLLGFTLPDPARVQQEWWTNRDLTAAPSGYARSWILASRTAKPNLLARTVMFERTH